MKHFCDEKGCRLVSDEEFERLIRPPEETKVFQIKSKFLRNIFDQNSYVVTNENEAVLIDAGAEIEDVKPLLEGKKLLGILITHLHFDHIFNLEKYLFEFDTKVFIKSGAEEKFESAEKNASTLLKTKSMTFKIDSKKICHYEKNLRLGKFDFEVIETPGHSGDSVCLKLGDKLFTGDTVFADSVGRFDLYDSSQSELISSLKKIENLDFSTAYPGHGKLATKEDILFVIKNFI